MVPPWLREAPLTHGPSPVNASSTQRLTAAGRAIVQLGRQKSLNGIGRPEASVTRSPPSAIAAMYRPCSGLITRIGFSGLPLYIFTLPPSPRASGLFLLA